MEDSDVKPGDILTVRVEIYKEHVPAQVVVMRVRRDMTWHDVLENYKTQVPNKADVAGTFHFTFFPFLFSPASQNPIHANLWD